jgi:hypothetical protein
MLGVGNPHQRHSGVCNSRDKVSTMSVHCIPCLALFGLFIADLIGRTDVITIGAVLLGSLMVWVLSLLVVSLKKRFLP